MLKNIMGVGFLFALIGVIAVKAAMAVGDSMARIVRE